MDNLSTHKDLLVSKGLKVTPQRLAVLGVLEKLHHPSADEVLEKVKQVHPSVATGTVYNILEQYTNKGIIEKVKTARDIMRYDFVAVKHHHLYCTECDTVADYFDPDLDILLENYFAQNPITGFTISDIKLQVNGLFKNHENKDNSLKIRNKR
jgi:Fur family peroxide stress response transcriptional regulator